MSIGIVYVVAPPTWDDLTHLAFDPQCSSVSLEEEFQHVQRWSQINKLQINISKTKELVFRRPSARHCNVPQPLPFVEQVTVTKLLRPPFLLLHMLNTF